MSDTKVAQERTNCQVRDGRFVEPCLTLQKQIEYCSNAGRFKGLFVLTYTNIHTRELSRSMVGIKTGQTGKGGLLLNFCPWCGSDISAPVFERPEGNKEHE